MSTRWEVTGRLRLTRRVVTQTRQIEVTVRREELIAEWEPAQSGEPTPLGDDEAWQPAQTRDPLVIVLHEEVPELTVRVRAYEQATATVTRHDGDLPVTGVVRKENVTLEHSTAPVTPAAAAQR